MCVKVKHYQDILHEYNETGDKTLLKKANYGVGYIDGATTGKRIKHNGSLAKYYGFGFEEGVKDKAAHEKKLREGR